MWWGCAGVLWDQRCELPADRAASLNLVYHIRHGNVTSIFFSLQDQSLHNPSKQQWNNSLFALCGLGGKWSDCSLYGGPQDPLVGLCAQWRWIFFIHCKILFPPTTGCPVDLLLRLHWMILQVDRSLAFPWWRDVNKQIKSIKNK